ncbi:MAG: hypothetical protein MZV64_70790 [Ignavibacteriales bacterium]|nr:hypothetical protein [Ignavibacteriales bacterium]
MNAAWALQDGGRGQGEARHGRNAAAVAKSGGRRGGSGERSARLWYPSSSQGAV